MAKRDLNLLLSVLTHPELYGLTYMLIYFELDDRSDGKRELHHVLFDDTGVEDPGEVPCRNLADPSLREAVARCVLEYPAVRAAAERVLFPGRMQNFRDLLREWWKQLLSRRRRSADINTATWAERVDFHSGRWKR